MLMAPVWLEPGDFVRDLDATVDYLIFRGPDACLAAPVCLLRGQSLCLHHNGRAKVHLAYISRRKCFVSRSSAIRKLQVQDRPYRPSPLLYAMTKLRKARPETATIPATPAPSSVRSAASEASPASGSPTATFGRRRHPPSAAAALSASPGAAPIQLSVAARPVTAVSSPASALLEEWEQPHRPIAASGAVEPW